MANPIFDRYLPEELAGLVQGIDFKGEVGELSRLSEIIQADLDAVAEPERPRQWRAAPVDIRLAFSWLDGQTEILAVDGRASAMMTGVCQRCLAVFEFEVLASIKAVLADATADATWQERFAEFDIWDLGDGGIRPIELVEESLVMAMPFAPVHGSTETCEAPTGIVSADVTDTVRPFADLRAKMEKVDN